jgi:Stage II sporulation protein E (SpoIIE)
VRALFSWFNPAGNEPIQSEAFGRAVVRSDRYRIVGMLCVCGVFALIDVGEALVHPGELRRYLVFLSWWSILAAYEGGLLLLTTISQRRGRPVRTWVWGINTAIECLLPSLAILGLTADKGYLGPYRALVSSSVGVYYFFIILSTLRLSPVLCIIAGSVCAAGYTAVYLFTLWVAPLNDYRNFMPQRNLVLYPVLLAGAGLLAAAVAQQIRRHVIAALAEAETRRKLDRIEYDLNIARSIQMGLLPKRPPSVKGYDIAGWSQPAEQTGGDYYDWLELPGGKILFTIADATGHGIGPALLVAACRAYFRAIAVHDDPLEEIAQQVDALIAVDVPDGRFITAAIALLDPTEHRLSLYSAGHAPLYHYSATTNQVTSLDADQPPLGCWPKEDNPLSMARIIPLSPGDSLVLVTDGFFECANGDGKMLAYPHWQNLFALRRRKLRSVSSPICINMFWNFLRGSLRRMI